MEKIRRFMAWLTIIVIVALLIGMLVCAVTGSRYFFVFLFLAIFIPILLWVFMWFTRLISENGSDVNEDESV